MSKSGFYHEGTNNKGVLLIHGLTGAPGEMSIVAKHLRRKGFTVYCPVLSGHCQDENALLKTTWQDWYKSVEDGYTFLQDKVEHVYMAGICAGGALALKFAAENPGKISGIALYSMTIRYDGWNIPKTRIFLPLLPIVAKLPFFKKMKFKEAHPYGIKNDRLRKRIMESDLLRDCLPAFPYYSMNQMYKLNDEVIKVLPNINTPVLLLHAKDDDLSRKENAEYIAKYIGGAHELHLLEDSYHMIHIDQESKQVAEYTANFFEKHGK